MPNEEEKPQDQTIENENQIQKNTEGNYIKPVKNQNIFLPIIICNQNHQTCLICKQSPHIDTLCNEKNIDYYNGIVKLYFIKEYFPEKSNIIESMKENLNKMNGNEKESCCSCKCFRFYALLVLWTIASIAIGVIGIGILLFSYLHRFINLIFLCCKRLCPPKEEHVYDKGDHIVKVTTINEDVIKEDINEAKANDSWFDSCGKGGASCAISLIPWGYKKIWTLRN